MSQAELPGILDEAFRDSWAPILNAWLKTEHTQYGTHRTFRQLKEIATNALTGGFGVTGDGSTNDTSAISSAITAAMSSPLNMWNGYHCLYFPGATYMVQQLSRSDISNLYIFGDGDSTIWRKPDVTGNIAIATLTTAQHFRITDMAFDANHLEEFGGFQFYRGNDIHIERCHYYDSQPRGYEDNAKDRYSFVFAIGGAGESTTSKNIYIGNNLIEDLQLEVDHLIGGLIEHNSVFRSPTTTAIGSFAVGDDNFIVDLTIRYNRTYDSDNHDICVLIDQPTYLRATIRNLNVYGNVAYRSRSSSKVPYSFGVVSTASAQDHIWNEIRFEGNEIHVDPSVPQWTVPIVRFMGAGSSNSHFVSGSISNNRIYGNGKGVSGNRAMEIRAVQGIAENTDLGIPERPFFVQGNQLLNLGVSSGLGVLNNVHTTHVTDNIVDAVRGGTAYTFNNSTSPHGNVVKNNKYIGNPNTLVDNTSFTATTLEVPVSATPAGYFVRGRVASWDPEELADGAKANTEVTIRDVVAGDQVQVSFSQPLQDLRLWGEVTANSTVTVYLENKTGANVDIEDGILNITVQRV